MRDLVRWSRFKHINILPLRGFYFDPTNHLHLSVVTTWQKNGNVLQYVVGKERDGGGARVPELVRSLPLPYRSSFTDLALRYGTSRMVLSTSTH